VEITCEKIKRILTSKEAKKRYSRRRTKTNIERT
jgi:hypothetical protein